MSPLTPDEHAYYLQRLAEAEQIVEKYLDECIDGNSFGLVMAVFEKIASPLHFLRQEQPQPIGSDGRETMNPPKPEPERHIHDPAKKPSRIFGEGTQWKQKTSPWGQPQEWSRQDYLADPLHQDILADLIRQKEGQPDAKVEVEHEGFVYWANPSKDGRWYLNRRRQP